MYLTPLEMHVQRFMYFHIYVACLLSVFIPHSSTKPDFLYKKVNRNVQEEPQAEVAANPRHQEEEKKWHRLTCA